LSHPVQADYQQVGISSIGLVAVRHGGPLYEKKVFRSQIAGSSVQRRLTGELTWSIIRIMNALQWQRRVLWTLAGVLAVAVSLFVLEGIIRLDARATGNRAAARFGGDRIRGLTTLVDCSQCSLRERDMAVWALGELRDRRASAVLKAHYTAGKCDHAADLCQYELGKAIMKIEGKWNLHASMTFRRATP
jgi:hypothetical protein